MGTLPPMPQPRNIRIISERPNVPGVLERYARIPIAFEVTSQFTPYPVDHGLGGLLLREEPVPVSYRKDYDTHEPPVQWRGSFDVTNWMAFTAFVNEVPAGGAVLACRTPGLDMLEGRDDLAVLWDLRVEPRFRRSGIGSALFSAAEQWASQAGCRTLKIETQNINVPACRFYVRHGCDLRSIHANAYREFPEEIQLLWYKGL
ncbi:MAG: GNAT family N-acetyltransferase [Armatimonadota bacterium]